MSPTINQPDHEQKAALYRLVGRRMYLLIEYSFCAILFLLLLFWQQRQQLNDMNYQLTTMGSGQNAPLVTTINSNDQLTSPDLTFNSLSTLQRVFNAGSILTSSNFVDYLDGLYVQPSDSPNTGDIAGSYDNGFNLLPDSVALGTDTTGDYVQSIIGGAGLLAGSGGEGSVVTMNIGAGDGVVVSDDDVSIRLQAGGGLAFTDGALSLQTSCTDGEVLKWDDSAENWVCSADDAGAGSLSVRQTDGSDISPVSILEFGPALSSDEEFIVSDEGSGVARLRLGTTVPLTNSDELISGTWAFSNLIAANGGLSCTNCVDLGNETTGSYLAGVLAGSGIGISGSGGEAASPTVSLDTSNANNWTGIQTFTNGFTLNGSTYTNLTGTGLGFSSGTLSATLGTSIDSAEIVNGTIVAADVADNTLTLAKLSQNGCSNNQIIKWNGSAWACADDVDTDTTYSAGSGLLLTGTTFSLDSSLGVFKTIDTSLGSDPIADSLTDSLILSSGNGVNVTGDASTDSVSFSLNIAAGGGLAISSGALTLLNTCGNGQYLAWTTGTSSWGCASISAAPNIFQTIAGDSGSAVADAVSDTLALVGGNGLTSTGSDVSDTVTLNIDLASGSGLTFSGGALTIQSCSDGQILKYSSGSWSCAADSNLSAATYKQQLAGSDNVTIGSSLTPLLTNGSGTAQSQGITITSGNEVSLAATVEVSSSLATGPVVYVFIRDDNHDNDCVTGGGDGTQIGGQVTSFLATVAQSFTTSLNFADSSPASTTSYYQLCASTTIGLGTTSATDRALTLLEINL